MKAGEVIRYFAYGSNMSVRRLRTRVPGAVAVGTYILQHHVLRFHKSGRDQSAKCDAFFTGKPTDHVYGVIFFIPVEEKYMLDRAEGLWNGYDQKGVSVINTQGERKAAFTYYATKIDDSLACFTWYKEHVLVGAHEAHLPETYISGIRVVDEIRDPDIHRENRELSIY